MPDQPASERTEQATPERLKKARAEGRVPQSAELPSALIVTMLLVVLALCAPGTFRWLVSQLRAGLNHQPTGQADAGFYLRLMRSRAIDTFVVLAPFLLAAAAASVFSSLLASGWSFSFSAVSPKPERISPAAGLKNLFSTRSAMNVLASLAKLAVIVAIVWTHMADKLDTCLSVRWASPSQAVATIAQLVFGVLVRVALGLAAIAAADLLFQRWKYRRDLRMTRQEVKEELKHYELSPRVKGRIRSIQLALAQKRMLREVPQADVVVVNPTHVAVALKYDAGTMEAPVVTAKGADLLAERIRRIAQDHGVPILHRPGLARVLYATVDVGRTIPEVLYVAVAEVLALIYRLKPSSRRPATPDLPRARR